ncbi:MAG: DUF1156 domain-containing protein [Fibrobacteres bacterium]|nr:DUF1156 domain-containing protein [Fibrobacterota bacterium]
MTHPVRIPRKLIETALPLEDINVACAREKSIRHGHPSTLHLYWARRPLAAARAVIWSQMVNDPSWKYEGKEIPNDLKDSIQDSRNRLFRILSKLVLWESTTNESVLKEAREEIWKSWRETCELNANHPDAATLFDPTKLPAFHDPFAGGGALPLEAQRLGLESWASDLNPVAVLINKAMIEIPPRFVGKPAIGPDVAVGSDKGRGGLELRDWKGAAGLAEDVRRYGAWMRERALAKIGHLYPKVRVTDEMVALRPDLEAYRGQDLTVIAWLWARTVKSPDPAFADTDVPLVSSFWLSTKPGKETWVEPVVSGREYKFVVRVGKPQDEELVGQGTKAARGANFTCLFTQAPVDAKHIKGEGMAGRMGARLMTIVAEGERGRVYLDPMAEMEEIALQAEPDWIPENALPDDPRNFWTVQYGLATYGSLFTKRQLVALNTFADLVNEAREKVKADALAAGWPEVATLDDGGNGAQAYADAVAVYLGLGVGRSSDFWCTIATWSSAPKNELVSHAFTKQAIPMTWDFAECNPLSDSGGNYTQNLSFVAKCIEKLDPRVAGFANQGNAQFQDFSRGKVISTDPPYYDNIGYADLSDFFYIWQRRTLRNVFPILFAGTAVPKMEELVATPYRHGGKANAEAFFLDGMTHAMHQLAVQGHPAFPVTIYYAFKQSESKGGGTASTGWETFLEAVIRAGFSLVGTWPMRTERDARSIGIGTNALASSIILVCRRRADDAPVCDRREFLAELKERLHTDLAVMIEGEDGKSPVAPVDLAQAAIGPGMGVYSKYRQVMEADGTPMPVREALVLINRSVDEFFGEAESDWDSDTKFCLPWFQKHGFDPGPFGDADQWARSKNTSVAGLQEAGVLVAKSGEVRLLRLEDYPSDWKPESDARIPVWESLHQMIRALRAGGSQEAGQLLARIPRHQEAIRKLAYRLYTWCERNGKAEDARPYNELATAWESIRRDAERAPTHGPQTELL